MKLKESSLIKYFMSVCPSVSFLVRLFVRQTSEFPYVHRVKGLINAFLGEAKLSYN